MTFRVIQLLLGAFAVFAISRTAARFRSGSLTRRSFLAWTLFWLGAGAIAVQPETANRLADLLGVGRGADVVVYLALVTTFYLLFRGFARLEELDRKITKLTTALALKDLEDEDHERS
jgi:hypothetical protein